MRRLWQAVWQVVLLILFVAFVVGVLVAIGSANRTERHLHDCELADYC